MNNECKLFLISSITYDETAEHCGSYIQAMRSFIKKYPDVQDKGEYRDLSGNEVFYSESKDTPDVSDISVETAINMAREFSMCSVTDFADPFYPIESSSRAFQVSRCQANLFYDSHAFFAIIYDITISYDCGVSENQVLEEVFNNRDILRNLDIEKYVESCRRLAVSKIHQIFKGLALNIKPDGIRFDGDSTLPFIMFPKGFEVDRRQFRNEEIISSIGESSQISSDYEMSFFHPGWNYTIASGFPYEVLINFVQMMVRAQSFFFSLTYIKSYYARELSRTVKQKDSILEFHVDTAEDVQLAFYSLLAQFNSYKNKMFPKYHHEFCVLMQRWHCDDDVENVKNYIELDIQSKDRIHSSKVEKQNDRQNKALTFIALVQVISIYGAFSDGNAIFNDNKFIFMVGTLFWSISILVYLIVSKYFKWAIAYFILVSISILVSAKHLNLSFFID